MPVFTIRFLKTVSNDIGVEREICQRTLDLEAADADQAVTAGQHQFCTLERIPNWTLRADRFELLLTEHQDDRLSAR